MTRDLHTEAAQALPVTILTGFLGSGKTTLLNRLLEHPDMGETAVLINEFGEVGLDHLLVRKVDEDIVLLNSGCVCCNVRGDLVNALRELFLKRVRGDVPEFQRVVVETTGLADPAPIIHTLMTDPLLGARYRLDGIVATIDAVHGLGQFDRQPESVKQAAVADRLVLTKTDLAEAGAVAALKARLRQLNPAAPMIEAARVTPAEILDCGLFNARDKHPDVGRWLAEQAYAGEHGHHHGHGHGHGHDAHIASFVVSFDEPVSWPALVAALELLIATRGEHVLRIKGIVNARDHAEPLVVHGVQHMFHPPVSLPAWPDDDHRTRLVFITRDLGREAVLSLMRTAVAGA